MIFAKNLLEHIVVALLHCASDGDATQDMFNGPHVEDRLCFESPEHSKDAIHSDSMLLEVVSVNPHHTTFPASPGLP